MPFGERMKGERKMEWTVSQKNAIDSRGRTLLVSAAAGSGKTAVLTSRIISRITDAGSPADISRMLAVTFTKAAAAELRRRISDALDAALVNDPYNDRLAKQKIRLSSANISTIDSFCNDIVKRYGSEIGLPAKLKIMDSAESDVLYSSVMDEVIEESYASDDDGRFSALADNLTEIEDTDFSGIFIQLYKNLICFPDGIELINPSRYTAQNDFSSSLYGRIICDYIKRMADHYVPVFEEALDYVNDDGPYQDKYGTAFSLLLNLMKTLQSASREGYSSIRTALCDFDKGKIKSSRITKTKETEFFSKTRISLTDLLDELKEQYFSNSEEDSIMLNAESERLCSAVYDVLKRFENRCRAEKLRQGKADFSDMEIYTYRILYDENGELTDTARSVAASYDEIYIDEYQDVNELQDAIFTAISNRDNRFMVGDVKQSIYGFRGASPSVFASYRDRFPAYDENSSDTESTIFLSDNFRCDKSIIDFSNLVFDMLFKFGSGKIPYSDVERLVCSKQDDGHNKAKVEIDIIEKQKKDSNKSNPGNENEEDSGADGSESEGTATEAEFVVKRIEELIRGEGYKPEDIVILLRSPNSKAEVYAEALKKLNIPYYDVSRKSFFENAEILLMLSLLNCIDNPSGDIYLAGTLRSPIFGFTLDELVNIRRYVRDCSLFDALKKYTEENSFEKGEYFLGKLEDYRKYASSQSVDRLIWYIYRDTGLLSLVYDNKDEHESARRENLMLLYDFARRYESGSFKGLYSFISYINGIISNKFDFSPPAGNNNTNSVRIMSIHQSKGLEFPVCFVSGVGNRFNTGDKTKTICFSRELGLTSKVKSKNGLTDYTPLCRKAADLSKHDEDIDEESRVLYVALTRARERLIITGTLDKADEKLDRYEMESRHTDRYLICRADNFLKWILYAVKMNPNQDCCEINVIRQPSAPAEESEICKDSIEVTADEALTEDIIKRFGYVYPYRHLTGIPAKLSVSKLSPTVLDEDDDSDTLEKPSCSFTESPSFISGEPMTASGAKKGTATHLFMQFCDYALAARNGVEAEIGRLVDEKFIDRATASLINVYQLKKFFSGDFFRELSSCRRMWRETRFNIRLDAPSFTKDDNLRKALEGETLLVQGVIDCFFITDDDRLVLVDYKTDYIPPEIMPDRAAAEKMLIDRHARQLSYYREACSRIMCRKVDEVLIYSFALGDTVEVREDVL